MTRADFEKRFSVQPIGHAWIVRDDIARKLEAGPWPDQYRARQVFSFMRSHCSD